MDSERYRAWRAEIESKFASATLVEGSTKTHTSPSGTYSLEISSFSRGEGRLQYSRGIVRDTQDNRVIAEIRRNYPGFWHAWVSHPNGMEYLLCGEDYQGYNVIELPTGINRFHFPDQAFQGHGFCWAQAYPSPDGRTIAIDGCYWAGPYEIVFYDFTDPTTLPLREIARIEDFDDSLGWEDALTFTYLTSEESGKSLARWVRDNNLHAPVVVIKEGTFLYGGEVECDLRIVHSPVRYGSGDPEDPPEVRDDVPQDTFYIQYGSTTERGIFPAGGGGYPSLEEAMAAAAAAPGIGSTVRWKAEPFSDRIGA